MKIIYTYTKNYFQHSNIFKEKGLQALSFFILLKYKSLSNFNKILDEGLDSLEEKNIEIKNLDLGKLVKNYENFCCYNSKKNKNVIKELEDIYLTLEYIQSSFETTSKTLKSDDYEEKKQITIDLSKKNKSFNLTEEEYREMVRIPF